MERLRSAIAPGWGLAAAHPNLVDRFAAAGALGSIGEADAKIGVAEIAFDRLRAGALAGRTVDIGATGAGFATRTSTWSWEFGSTETATGGVGILQRRGGKRGTCTDAK